MKKILKILLAVFAPLWLAFSCAHAEEVELIPQDTWYYSMHFESDSADVQYSTVSMANTPSYRLNGDYWLAGNFLVDGNAKIAYTAPYSTDSDHLGAGWYTGQTYLNQLLYQRDSTGGSGAYSGVMYCTYGNSTLTLDVSNLLSGWYRYESEIYIGLAFASTYTSGATLDPTFTYSSDPLSLPTGGTIQYMGTETVATGWSSPSFPTKLLHFHFEDTLLIDPNDSSYTWDITPAFQYLISTLEYPSYYSGKKVFSVFQNNRLDSSLFSNVEPPVTPTPTPTPSPNQDVINNNNQNTTNIISSINNGFDALAAAFEGTIYGLTDLFFGDLTDWLDFFSDVEDDFEDNLPVVEFFSIVRNIFANFFPEVSSTDPSSLQFVAGWQSDIYVLHVPSLSLVLPEGTFPFFPEVNFDLNNEFMNLIRPYWLTFCNLLVTLLWFRYLLHYLFRWSQLLTGNTAAAFELFMHQPEELDQLAGIGEDPYDLAGDYAYDEIDSEFHDTYQAAEHHYGHGAARYLSGVLHGRIKS